MRISVLAVAACALASISACSKKTDRAAPAPSAKAQASEPAPVSERDVFTGSTATVPAAAAKLRFGMTEAEARAAAPELFASKVGYTLAGSLAHDDETKLQLQISHGRLYAMWAELQASQDAAKQWLAQKWGPPIEGHDASGHDAIECWASPATGIHARLEGNASRSNLYFSAILPLDQLLGSDPKRFGIEPQPFIGMTKDDAMKALAAFHPEPREKDPGALFIDLPPTEAQCTDIEGGGSLDLRIKHDKVTGYELQFYAGNEKELDAFVAKLDGMFGKGKKQGSTITFPGPQHASVDLYTEHDHYSATLKVGDPDA